MKRINVRGFIVAVACVGFTIGAVAVFTEAQAGGCRCPLIYAPVICDHGKTYPNPCEADCHHATNCVPTGPFVQ
jgi:hypothetical protein